MAEARTEFVFKSVRQTTTRWRREQVVHLIQSVTYSWTRRDRLQFIYTQKLTTPMRVRNNQGDDGQETRGLDEKCTINGGRHFSLRPMTHWPEIRTKRNGHWRISGDIWCR